MSAETLTEEGSGPRTAYSVVRVHVRCCNWSAELCRNCVRSPRNRRQISTFTGSHREAFCGGKSLNPLREEVFPYHSVSVAGIVFQACSIDHSDISPFRINSLRAAEQIIAHAGALSKPFLISFALSGLTIQNGPFGGNCVRPLNAPRSLTAILLSQDEGQRQPRSSHRRLIVESRSPVPLHTKADAPTSKDRCLTSGSFIAENTITLASGLSCLI